MKKYLVKLAISFLFLPGLAAADSLPLTRMPAETGGVNFWLAILILLFVLLGAWSALGNFAPMRGPKAKGLYLPMRYRSDRDPAKEHLAHVISLNTQDATLVLGRFVDKGERLNLDLSTLPDFPPGQLVAVEVQKSRVLGSHPVSCLVRVKFAGLGPKTREPLTRYVQNLARQHGAPTGA